MENDEKSNTLRELVIIGGVVFLLVTLSFGIGWLLGSRNFLQRPPIIINCPKDFYERN
jgi:hypothetical protein